MRLYVNNDSYPELREIESRWERHCVWWRAFGSAFRDRRFWIFCAVQTGLVLAWAVAGGIVIPRLPRGFALRVTVPMGVGLGAAVIWCLLAVTWGGDLMRPHLRRASPAARAACPRCGHRLDGQLREAAARGIDDAPDDHVRCPECNERIPRSVFSPPFTIPGQFLSRGR